MKKRKPQATRSTSQNSLFEGKLKPLALGGLALLGLAVVINLFGNDAEIAELPAPDPIPQQVSAIPLDIELSEVADADEWETQNSQPQVYEVKSGDSMSILFERAGIGPGTVHQLAYETEHGSELSKIQPGKYFEFHFNEANELDRADYVLSPLERYIAEAGENGFETRHQVLQPDISPKLAVGEINSSLYMAGLNAGLSDNLIMELATIFGWDIDFVFDIREGDQFSVLFEERYLNGEKLGNGNILAAEFINRGRSYKAVRYEDASGKVAFYTPDGESMRKAFLRNPLDVFRITSRFDLNRKHPILNTIRAHKGVDYAASRGTPIKATGSGRITYASTQGGYGNVVKIQHAQTYRTVYAHLDRFAGKTKVGRTVEQGDIIGYVGSTGLATGPHLHYEFYVNGAVRNPMTVELPNGTPVPQNEMERFKALTQTFLALLDGATVKYASTTIHPPSES